MSYAPSQQQESHSRVLVVLCYWKENQGSLAALGSGTTLCGDLEVIRHWSPYSCLRQRYPTTPSLMLLTSLIFVGFDVFGPFLPLAPVP